ncbi:MAG: hypothetical protein COA77_05915 [Thaumarchaeota archaeon]|nr:MAG: hypothetical protein COA77_05915 [Nitrososphaerota archaeon]
MKTGFPLIIIGIIMFTMGLVIYYSIQSGQTDLVMRNIKYVGGTFVGLTGMGVTLAGILLYLISRNEAPIQKKYDI